MEGVSKYFLKYGEHCIDDFQSISVLYTISVCAVEELCVPRRFLAILSVFYIADGPSSIEHGGTGTRFNFMTLLAL